MYAKTSSNSNDQEETQFVIFVHESQTWRAQHREHEEAEVGAEDCLCVLVTSLSKEGNPGVGRRDAQEKFPPIQLRELH